MSYLGMQNHQNENLSLNRFEDTSQHAQPILPNLADFSACVQPALQNGPGKVFHFDDFACPYSSFTQINHWNVLYNYFIEIIIAMRGVCEGFKNIYRNRFVKTVDLQQSM